MVEQFDTNDDEVGNDYRDIGMKSHSDFIHEAFTNRAGGLDMVVPGWDAGCDTTPLIERRAGLHCTDHRKLVAKFHRLSFWDPDVVEHWNFSHPQVGACKGTYPLPRERRTEP